MRIMDYFHTNPVTQAPKRATERLSSLTAVVCLTATLLLPSTAQAAFKYDDVVEKARLLANEAYAAPAQIPDALKALDYDAYRDIRFRPEKTQWLSKRGNFDVQFIHTGFLFNYGIDVSIYDSSGIWPMPYGAELFDYGRNVFDEPIPAEHGYAGFKVRYPLNNAGVQDEVISFAGASYFRAIGKGAAYGLSARGLAIDTGLPSGEEFPYFKSFWLERPTRRAEALKIYALLDSKRVTGAYRFVVYPGETTRVKVKATLFLREQVEELGIAPLTSMFYFGETLPRPVGEWRPEVHDSDGLLLRDGTDEVIWRPLANEKRLRLNSYYMQNPKGFGLLQRDRIFDHYEDLETMQQNRPSLWVEPHGDWGKGYVKLTEIPTNNEFNDNIVAYWVSSEKHSLGEPIDLQYTLHWQLDEPMDHLATVLSTRIGNGLKNARQKRFVVEFSGVDIDEESKLIEEIEVGEGGTLIEHQLYRNQETGGWRLSFLISPPDDKPLQLTAKLRNGDRIISEKWSYLYE